MLDELNTYRGKLMYFFKSENEWEKEYVLQMRNLNFNERLSKIESFMSEDFKSHLDSTKHSQTIIADIQNKIIALIREKDN